MRLAIISDLHLGDSLSVMAYRDLNSGEIKEGVKFDAFIHTVRSKNGKKKLDYLVLLGDILDFSIASYTEAYSVGKFFFQKIRDAKITKEIIYIPGNHDFDLWNTVEYEVSVTNRVKRGKIPEAFKMSVPAILDDRKHSRFGGLSLFGVHKNRAGNKPHYTGLFMDKLTKPATPFNFAFPNLYLITQDETVLITHGQYLEAYWAIMGEWSQKIFKNDLKLAHADGLNLKESVALNFPFSQIACSAIGQAGPLTLIIQKLEHEITGGDLSRLTVFLNRLEEELSPRLFKGISGIFKHAFFRLGKKELLTKILQQKPARYDAQFMENPLVRERFVRFYESVVLEIAEIQIENGIEIPLPSKMIFGHTHQPIAWNAPESPSIQLKQLGGKPFRLYNTGGWLKDTGKDSFCGAEVFFYESGEGFSSVAIK